MLFSAEIDACTLHSIKKIIAREAVFFPEEKFADRLQSSDTYPHLILSANGYRMRRATTEMWKQYFLQGKVAEDDKKKRRTELVNLENLQETIYVTDNANSRIKKTFKDAGLVFADKKYEICHIGKNTAHNLETFGAIPNLVFLPRWIASPTDHLEEIENFLLSKSYSLYYGDMKKYTPKFDVDRFFLLLCGNDEKRYELIKNSDDMNKYDWERSHIK